MTKKLTFLVTDHSNPIEDATILLGESLGKDKTNANGKAKIDVADDFEGIVLVSTEYGSNKYRTVLEVKAGGDYEIKLETASEV